MRVCVLGAHGFIGKNLCRGTSWIGVTRDVLNLLNQEEVKKYFDTHTYDVVIHCAVVGGSRLETDGSDVLYKNILMFENVALLFQWSCVTWGPTHRPLRSFQMADRPSSRDDTQWILTQDLGMLRSRGTSDTFQCHV